MGLKEEKLVEEIKSVDFHGLTIEEAYEKVDKIVGQTRIARKALDYKFITGNGELQLALLQYLKDVYQIECGLQYSNHGVILVYVE